MKPFAFCMVILSAMALVGTAWAGKDKDEPRVRLELDLADGSLVVGILSIESLPVQTSYAKMDVAVKQILTIKIAEDHETASIDLRNGDKLKGVISLPPIQLETVFGSVKIGIEHIRSLRVVLSGGAMPDSLTKGMVLYYSFDKDEGGCVTDKSEKKNNGDAQQVTWTGSGKAGGACKFDGSKSFVFSQKNIGVAAAQANSVCAWFKGGDDGAYKCAWFMGDGAGNSQNAHGVCIHTTTLSVHYPGVGDSIATNIDPKEWNFVCRTYDGTTQYLYLNGILAGKESRIADLVDSPFSIGRWKTGNTYTYNFQGTIDEVMVFDRALSVDEVKQIYDAQK